MDQLSATLSLIMMVLDLLQQLMYQVLTAVVVCVNMCSLLQPAVYHHSIMFPLYMLLNAHYYYSQNCGP